MGSPGTQRSHAWRMERDRDCITLLRMVRNFKLRSYLFLECSIYYFLAVGNRTSVSTVSKPNRG